MTNDSTRGWPLADFRFEGYSDLELAEVVDQLGQGPGAGGMTAASNNLNDIADSLDTINATLSRQLGEIGVQWQSREAADAAHRTLGDSRNYGQDAGGQVAISATSIDEHGEAYRVARRGLPDSSALRDPGYIGGGRGFTGHEMDHTEAMRRREAARNQAIDALNRYGDDGRQSVDQHQPLPPPVHQVSGRPPAQHEEPVGGTSPSHVVPPGSTGPSGSPGPVPSVPGPGGGHGLPTNPPPVVGGGGPVPGGNPIIGGQGPVYGGPGQVGPTNPAPVGGYPAPIAGGGQAGAGQSGGGHGGGQPGGGQPGGGAQVGGGAGGGVGKAPVGGLPGGTGAVPGGAVGGAPGSGGGVLPGPGGKMGIGPVEPGGGPVSGTAGAAGLARGAGMGSMAHGAMNAIAGGASGAGAAAAGAENGERVVRGRPGGTPMTREGAMSGVDPESPASRAASRIGSTGSRSGSMMGPAAGTERQEEDGSHVRRYGVEAEDLFADQRMVADPVLGDDEPER